MSWVKSQKEKYATNKAKVQEILGWDDLQYGNFQHEQGLRYLQKMLKLTPTQMRAMSRSKLYWNWWINQWDYIDCYHFLPGLEHIRRRDIAQAYANVHHPNFCGGRVTQEIWDDTFEIMAVEFIKQELQKPMS